MRFAARCMNKQKLFEEFKLASKGEKIRISKQMLEISSKQIHLEQVKAQEKKVRKKFTSKNKGEQRRAKCALAGIEQAAIYLIETIQARKYDKPIKFANVKVPQVAARVEPKVLPNGVIAIERKSALDKQA